MGRRSVVLLSTSLQPVGVFRFTGFLASRGARIKQLFCTSLGTCLGLFTIVIQILLCAAMMVQPCVGLFADQVSGTLMHCKNLRRGMAGHSD